MEISITEYNALMFQISTLQKTVDALQKLPPKNIKNMLKEQVIDRVTNLDDSRPIFGYGEGQAEAWNYFLQIAKVIHTPSKLFYLGTACGDRPYIRCESTRNSPKRIKELTAEQVAMSVQMLNEITPIYNRYFKLLHSKVMYDPTGKGDYELIGVLDERKMEVSE